MDELSKVNKRKVRFFSLTPGSFAVMLETKVISGAKCFLACVRYS